MASVNKAIIIGNLGRDPEVRYTQSGRAMTRFSVATTETWTDRDNGRQERTDWHNIVVWGKQAETCGQYLSKGQQVYIEGSIRPRSYEDKDGNTRYTTDIEARRVQFLSSRDGGGARSGQSFDDGPSGGFDDAAGAGSVPPDDDVPF